MAHASAISSIDSLPPELLAEIHGRLAFVDCLAFAAACGPQARRLMKAEAPCLLLPGVAPERVTIISLTDRRAAVAAARAPDPAMRDHVVLGSSAGWLVTADARGTLRMANPVTGEQADLPAITTIPFLRPLRIYCGACFRLCLRPFTEARFGHEDQTADQTTFTYTAGQMRLSFYGKVVLSNSPSPRSYAAMLILSRRIGAPAFATAENPAWRLAPSRDGVEDAIHHNGTFYSITYSGAVEAWDRVDGGDTGEFASRVIAPTLAFEERHLSRKYLAAAPDGRLMAVLKYTKYMQVGPTHTVKRVFFKVHVLDEAGMRWEETADIGDAALFVGANASLCVSTREHRGLRAGCVYFADDEVRLAWLRQKHCTHSESEVDDKIWDHGVYSLKVQRILTIQEPPRRSPETDWICSLKERPRWPLPAWFVPSV